LKKENNEELNPDYNDSEIESHMITTAMGINVTNEEIQYWIHL
jgi:hypothetical protein